MLSVAQSAAANPSEDVRLVIITGLSGSGKGTVLNVFEDMGFYPVDNLPVDLIPAFTDLCRTSAEISRVALVVDIREGKGLSRFPQIYNRVKAEIPSQLLFMEAKDDVLQRRFSETRRPHPIGSASVPESIAREREMLSPIWELADIVIDSSQYEIHGLRRKVRSLFEKVDTAPSMRVTVGSFGFKHGVPTDADLIFDARFLPNPHYDPVCRYLSGKDRPVADFVRKFPQTQEFLARAADMISFLLPHYVAEGKSYLTIYFGCTGGRHRSVFLAETISERLTAEGGAAAVYHRDIEKGG